MAGRQLSYRNEGCPTLGAARTRLPERLTALATAAVALFCYYGTLLPGIDLGDSASFQTGVGSLTLTPRQAYPLYYGLGNLFVWLVPGEPAWAMNLASAVYGAGAVGLATQLGYAMTGSRLSGAASGLFLAFSYTFWTQAVTAEVYTLHLLIAGAAWLTLLRWAEKPTTARLAVFYAIFAVGFGNHLSMILLLPAFATFLLLMRRRGDGDPLQPKMIGLAALIAVAAAMQYAWNFRGLWAAIEPPASMSEGLAKFWFDVTKADWRDTLVMNLSETGLKNRPAMYWFDLQQQFGIIGVLLAALGFMRVLFDAPGRALLLVLVYLANLIFAWTYNVGDAYVFFLPSHYVLALCAGAGVAAIMWMAARISNRTLAIAAGIICLAYPAWRAYDTWPAVDRSRDRRAEELLAQFTSPPPAGSSQQFQRAAIYGVDTNWQVQNAFEYFMRERKPGVGWFTTDDLLWLQRGDVTDPVHDLINSNHEIGRQVIVSPMVYGKLKSRGYAGIAAEIPDLPFDARLAALRAGTPYVLGVLRPDREYPIDHAALATAWDLLTARSVGLPELRQYLVAIGRAGEKPAVIASADRPYRIRTRIDGREFDVRMESWLPTDTIRRAGFGHVILDRQHLLTLERGVSFVAVGGEGGPVYRYGLFAPIPRHILGMRPQD